MTDEWLPDDRIYDDRPYIPAELQHATVEYGVTGNTRVIPLHECSADMIRHVMRVYGAASKAEPQHHTLVDRDGTVHKI